APPLGPGEGGGGRADPGRRPEDYYYDADPQVGLLVAHEPRRDPLVDHVGLLEEQLPGRDRGADDPDDEQHDGRHLARPAGQPGYDESVRYLPDVGVGQQDQRDQQQRPGAERDRDP